MDRCTLKLGLLCGALFAWTGNSPAQPADADFESTIGVVGRGAPLAGIPKHPGVNRPDTAQAAQEKGDIFAAGRPLSITDTLLAPAGIDHGTLGLSAVSGITNGLSSN